ncbi:MAG: hypothetical protein AB7O39_03380 [Flavobacteriaceae bacterium]
MTRYAEIIERLEGADGPDRLTDANVLWITNPEAFAADAGDDDAHLKYSYCYGRGGWTLNRADRRYLDTIPVPTYTASLDAAVALVERLLPGHPWTVWSRAYGAVAHQPEGRTWSTTNDPLIAEAWKRTPPIHLLIALFRALQAKEAGQP